MSSDYELDHRFENLIKKLDIYREESRFILEVPYVGGFDVPFSRGATGRCSRIPLSAAGDWSVIIPHSATQSHKYSLTPYLSSPEKGP